MEKMDQINPQNERIKKRYFRYAKEAKQRNEKTIDGVRKAILRFESYTGFKDFKSFTEEQAVGFKKHLAKVRSQRKGEALSASTIVVTLNALKDFFRWLAYQPGFKSHIHMPHIEYLNASAQDTQVAKASSLKDFPTLEQVQKVIRSMPSSTEIEQRNRALLACALLTGARVNALASLCLKHVELERSLIKQHPKDVRTKFSKRIDSFFFPVGDDIKNIFIEWIRYLREVKLYGNNDPVFPRTKLVHDKDKSFTSQGLEPLHWATTTGVRQIFKDAFQNAGLPYYNPHSLRNTLVQLGGKVCKTPEDYKAWSQNLGHEEVLTTFTSYGSIHPYKQGEIIEALNKTKH